MRQCDLNDLFVIRNGRALYPRFDPKVLRDHGLHVKTSIRWNERTKQLVYVIKRSKPGEGFETGNFAVDCNVLNWLIEMQGIRRRSPAYADQSYVVLVNDWDGPIVARETAKNVMGILEDVVPYNNDSGGFWWVDDEFEPIGNGSGPTIKESPFPLPSSF